MGLGRRRSVEGLVRGYQCRSSRDLSWAFGWSVNLLVNPNLAGQPAGSTVGCGIREVCCLRVWRYHSAHALRCACTFLVPHPSCCACQSRPSLDARVYRPPQSERPSRPQSQSREPRPLTMRGPLSGRKYRVQTPRNEKPRARIRPPAQKDATPGRKGAGTS